MVFTTQGNNSLLFQKAYYYDLNWNDTTSEIAALHFSKRLQWLKDAQHQVITDHATNTQILCSTTYPGLVTGVGVKHETKSKGELKLGFEFDYTTGMPVIRGHSVKGCLRAAFPKHHKDNEKYKYEKAYQLHCILNGHKVEAEGFESFRTNQAEYQKIIAIESEIFDGKIEGKLISAYRQDAFFDAFIKTPDARGKYLGEDSITPHGDNPLKNPVPIPFLKILPDVAIQFNFNLHDNGLIDIAQKKRLFEYILTTYGIGAKTNVGYGQLNKIVITRNLPEDVIPAELHKLLKNNKIFEGTISEVTNDYVCATFELNRQTLIIYKKPDKVQNAAIGKKALLKVNKDFMVTQKLNCKISLIP